MQTHSTSVSPQAMELVFQLCEQEPPGIDWHVMNMHFHRLGEELLAAGALVETTPMEAIVIPVDIDDELVEFDWDAGRQAYVGFHPSMGLVQADPRTRKRYRLDFDWLLATIAGAAGIAPGRRPVCLVDDLLWDLGDAWIRRSRRPILFACRLGGVDELDRVEHALTAREGRADGVLLTTSPRISRAVRLPGRHRILHIRDCLDRTSRQFALDPELIAGGRVDAGSRAPDAVEMGPGGAWIRINGREYRFRGLIQRSIVQQLYEAWRDGAGPLSTQEVLETAESKSRELAQAFSGRPEFKDIIGYEHGLCWLKVE